MTSLTPSGFGLLCIPADMRWLRPLCDKKGFWSGHSGPADHSARPVNKHAQNTNRYVDASGANVPADGAGSLPSLAAMVYASDDGFEELHLFFDVASYDVGSWAWGHFAVEWGTRGVFQVRKSRESIKEYEEQESEREKGEGGRR